MWKSSKGKQQKLLFKELLEKFQKCVLTVFLNFGVYIDIQKMRHFGKFPIWILGWWETSPSSLLNGKDLQKSKFDNKKSYWPFLLLFKRILRDEQACQNTGYRWHHSVGEKVLKENIKNCFLRSFWKNFKNVFWQFFWTLASILIYKKWGILGNSL